MFKLIRQVLIVFTLVTILVAGAAVYSVYQSLQYKNPTEVEVEILKGSSVKRIAALLAKEDVVESAWKFETYIRVTNQAKGLKAGNYVFEEGLLAQDVLDKMIAGKVKLSKFTLPEGYNIHEVCKLLVNKNLMTADQCDTEVKRVELIREDNQNIKTLEGYLFPDTYSYGKNIKASQLTQQMVNLFYKKVGSERFEKAKKMGFSPHQLIIFASIVEKETGLAKERPLIASVFHNRLKKGMLLQTDPTVIYGIKNFDGNIRRSDLKTDTPYNTYTRPGLPIGPICNPGLESIDAVLNPLSSPYIYFVAKGDGSHYFSETLAQHNKAVQYYQLKKGNEPAPVGPVL